MYICIYIYIYIYIYWFIPTNTSHWGWRWEYHSHARPLEKKPVCTSSCKSDGRFFCDPDPHVEQQKSAQQRPLTLGTSWNTECAHDLTAFCLEVMARKMRFSRF